MLFVSAALYAHLTGYDAATWRRAVETLSAEIHVIDRNATRIWFAFYPLELHEALADGDEASVVRRLGLMGRWRLADQIDESHRFFFAHRFWPQVKSAVQHATPPFSQDLAALMTAIADAAARTARLDREFLVGLSAAALMTLRQVGPDAFAAAPGKVHLSPRARALSPVQIMKRRARDNSQGMLGFLRGLKKVWSVTFDENEPDSSFTVINGQEMASGAQTDKRDYRARDPRCTPGEGPIPVECRAASCGTCWIGVLGGADKLSPVVERDERKRMQVFGYVDTPDERPVIRLACQARVSGAVSIVIPPWNGIIGSCFDRRQ